MHYIHGEHEILEWYDHGTRQISRSNYQKILFAVVCIKVKQLACLTMAHCMNFYYLIITDKLMPNKTSPICTQFSRATPAFSDVETYTLHHYSKIMNRWKTTRQILAYM